MRSRNRRNDKLQAVALFILLFFGFYFVFSSFNSNKKIKSDEIDMATLDQQVDTALNRSLRSVYNKKHLRDLEVSSNNTDLSQKFREKIKTQSKEWAPPVDASTELYDEANSGSEVSLSSLSVENQLRDQLDKRKSEADQESYDKKEYIRQYKENARKDGWIVELNDNLEVISAKPVKL
jgi:hypothetical protein